MVMDTKSAQVHMRIHPKILHRLRIAATERGLSVSSLIALVCSDWLAADDRRRALLSTVPIPDPKK